MASAPCDGGFAQVQAETRALRQSSGVTGGNARTGLPADASGMFPLLCWLAPFVACGGSAWVASVGVATETLTGRGRGKGVRGIRAAERESDSFDRTTGAGLARAGGVRLAGGTGARFVRAKGAPSSNRWSSGP